MMFMRMMGGANGAQNMGMNYQSGIGMEDVRNMITETVSALLPGVQQMLPQQASVNEDIIKEISDRSDKDDKETYREKRRDNQKFGRGTGKVDAKTCRATGKRSCFFKRKRRRIGEIGKQVATGAN